jgi:anaerobic selenocysteine-containing dehydrogenase
MGLVQGSSIDRRFFHCLGASKLDRTICSMAGTVGMRMTVGANVGADVEGVPDSDLVLLWGTNTLTSNPHMWPRALAERRLSPSTRSERARRRSATSGCRSGRGRTPHWRSE